MEENAVSSPPRQHLLPPRPHILLMLAQSNSYRLLAIKHLRPSTPLLSLSHRNLSRSPCQIHTMAKLDLNIPDLTLPDGNKVSAQSVPITFLPSALRLFR